MTYYGSQPKTKKGVATKQKIICAAASVFYEKGFHGGSISDITKKAGVGNGTFYIYFDSKISIYRYLLIDYGKRVRRRCSDAIKTCPNRKEAERAGIRAFFEYVMTDKAIFNIVWESLYIDKSLFFDFYNRFSRSYVAKLNAAQKAGEVRDIDPEIVSYAIMGIVNFVSLNSLVLKGETNIDYYVNEIMKILDGGMFTF